MMSKSELKKKVGEESGNRKLFSDIEAISKALYLDKAKPRSSIPTISSRSKAVAKTQLPESRSTKSKDSDEDPKEKKSLWSWKGIKALAHVRNKRFNCCFSLQVHSIEGLPPNFNDLSLSVCWKRRDGELMIRPSRVFQGVAEFDEELSYTCSVYGSRSGPHHSAKYEAKHFLLYASVVGLPELDLGKHRIDLTRLLPLTLEELEEEKSSGKWTTSYKLSGKAKGASMNVSFGYSVVGNSPPGPMRQTSTSLVKSDRFERASISRTGSLPARSRSSSRSVEDIKDLHEVLPVSSSELSASVDVLYQKFDEEKANPVNAESLFLVVEHGIEMSTKEEVKSKETDLKACDGSEEVAVAVVEDPKIDSLVKEFGSQTDKVVISEINDKDENLYNKESLVKELESALSSVSDPVNEGSDSQEELDRLHQEKNLDAKSDYEGGRKGNKESDGGLALSSSSNLEKEVPESLDKESENQERFNEYKSDYKWQRKGKSLSMDYASESVASDFLDMLGIDHSPFGLSSESEPDSPRERLLRQFEKDSLANGGGFLNFDIAEKEMDFGLDDPSGWGPVSEESGLSSVIQASEEMLKLETQEPKGKTRASLLEDMETEALMREWGLNEKAFQRSRSNSPRGFGSPIDISPEEPLLLPPLGKGLGPFVQTSNGGFLRSMSPELFRTAKSGGNLVMQVSSPVVVPAEMGSGIMDILQGLASVGIEKLSIQANKLMPLEDITGKTMQQIAWEAGPTLEAPERQVLLRENLESGESACSGQTRVKGKSSGGRSRKYEANSIANRKDTEFVSLDDLAPLAMDKIEALSIEGLRIQSGMTDEEAPSNISPQSIGDISALEGKRVNVGGSLGLEGAGGLQLLDIKDCGDDVDGIMGLSLTLDEWMRLDSGEIDDEDGISERTSKILAAHHASDLMRARTGERKRGKGSRRGGLLGNNFTVALMVQLRDPMRNFEPVGTPMLALIQVERVFVPPKPKIYSTVSELWKYIEDEDEPPQPLKKEEIKNEEEEEKVHEEEANTIAQFKITEVHVAGLKTEPTKKKLWGSSSQQQSGSRWLVANGMGKKKDKHPLMKSKAAAKASADSLWSISSKQKGSVKESPHVRNPNVIVPNETMKVLSGAGFL